jgi:carbon-monoxide dehydrogenase medium subunit
VPAQAPKTGVAFTEVARRHGDFALVGVTASVTLNGSGCADATVVLLGVADRPVHVAAVADILRGEAVTEGAAREAGDAAAAAIDPAGDLHASAEYRKEVAAVLTRRALLEAAAKAAA